MTMKVTDRTLDEARTILVDVGMLPGSPGYEDAVDNVAMGIAHERGRLVEAARATADVDREACNARIPGFALLHSFADFIEGAKVPWAIRDAQDL